MRLCLGLDLAKCEVSRAGPPDISAVPLSRRDPIGFPTQADVSTSVSTSLSPLKRSRRILIFRSCRLLQFQAALQQIRADAPDAEVWAFGHERFRQEMLDAGADQVIGHRAGRFGFLRCGLAILRRLQLLNVDAVVLPLMDSNINAAANLLRFAVVLGAPRAVLVPGQAGTISVDRRSLFKLAVVTSLRCPEGLRTLWQMMSIAWRPPSRRPLATRAGSRQRVLHIINSLGVGGAQTQLTELIARTPPTAFDVDLLVLQEDEDRARDKLTRTDVRIRSMARTARLCTPIDAIAGICREGDYDIVHTWLPEANMYGSAAARRAGVPRVITSVRSLNPGHYPQWCQWWYRPADILAARLADVVTVNAAALVSDHARWAWWPSSRIEVVHNGLELPMNAGADDLHCAANRRWLRHVLGVTDDVRLVGTIGRLAIEKDQDTFIQALARVRDHGLVCHAVLVGNGPCEPKLRARVTELHLDDRVTFMGSRDDAVRVMAALDLFVLTSRIEGFPNVLLEAALLGVPLITSDAGGVRDLVNEPEAVFPVADPRATAAAIRAALQDPDRTRARTARLRERSRALFGAERMASRWLSLYASSKPSPAARLDPQRPTAGTWAHEAHTEAL